MTIRIEIDDHDEIAARLRALADKTQSLQLAYKARYDALPEAEREGVPEPEVDTVTDMWERIVRDGAASVLHDGAHPPNCVLNVNARPIVEIDAHGNAHGKIAPTYRYNEALTVYACLPIGAEVIALESTKEDGPNWLVRGLTFGCMNIVSPFGECVPLSDLRYVTRHDLLSLFDRMKTKVDVQVAAHLICKKDGATFDGLRLHLFQEEQVYAIGIRIERAEGPCEHPESHVVPLRFYTVSHYAGAYYPATVSYIQHPSSMFNPHPLTPRFLCRKCGLEVAEATPLAKASA